MDTSRLRSSRLSTTGGPSSDLANSTDAICRTLRSYRKKITASSDNLPPETLRELERELGLTARVVGEKAMKAKGAVDESIMVKLLSQYSERLIEMLDERFKGVVVSPSKENSSPTEENAAAAAAARDGSAQRSPIASVERRVDALSSSISAPALSSAAK
jgi:hypothetical protein